MATYSFLDTAATISGPGGIVSFGSGNANAEEGISVEFVQDTDLPQYGADGSVVHNLNAVRAARFRVKLLKTSPVNNQLMTMYNLQRTSSALWAQNTISVSNPVLGDVYTGTETAFMKNPANQYAKEAGTIEWEFLSSQVDAVLGTLVN